MWRRSLARLAAVAAVVAPFTLTACSPDKLASSDGEQLGEFAVTADVIGTPVATLVVTVTAADIARPPVFNLTVQNGTASGTIKIPPGLARRIGVEAFDSDGGVTHEGHKTIDVRPGQNPPVNIPMVSKAGHVDITVQLGAVSVVVTPNGVTTFVDGTTQLTAVITAANGDVLSDAVPDWATSNPTIAKVDAHGKVTGVGNGAADIVATYAGIAGISHVTVEAACLGCNWTASSVALYGPSFNGLFEGMWGSGGENVYGVTTGGDILRYNGTGWRLESSKREAFFGIHGTSPSDIWAVGTAAYHFDGTQWAQVGTLPIEVAGVFTSALGAPSGAPVVYLASFDGKIFKLSGSEWTTDYSGASTDFFTAIWGNSATDVYAVGGDQVDGTGDGIMVHYDGNAWTKMPFPGTQYFNSVWGTSSTNVYAAAATQLLHYDGTSWTPEVLPGDVFPEYLTGSSANDVFLTSARSLYHFDGNQWMRVDQPASWSPYAFAAWGGTPTGVFLGGIAGGSVVYRNGEFTRLSLSPRVFGASVVSNSLAYAVAEEGLVYRFDGTSWSVFDGPGTSGYPDVWANSANDVSVLQGNRVRHWDGNFWTFQSIPGLSNSLKAFGGSSANNLFAVGNAGKIARYDGSTWSLMTSGVTATLNSVWTSGPAEAYAVGNQGTVLHYDGNVWSTVATPFSAQASVLSVSGTGANDVYVAGSDPTAVRRVIHFDGTNWTVMPDPNASIRSIFASRSNDVYAVGFSFQAASYAVLRWNGSTWQTKATSTTPLLKIAGLRGGDVLAMGTAATILRGNSPASASLMAAMAPPSWLRASPATTDPLSFVGESRLGRARIRFRQQPENPR